MAEPTDKVVAGLAKQVAALEARIKQVEADHLKTVGQMNEILKNAKSYIDDNNKTQDKRMDGVMEKANEIFRNAKKYIDEANKKQDAVIKKLEGQVKKK